MRKIIMFSIMLLLCFVSANASTLVIDQSSVISDYSLSDLGMSSEYIVLGVDNSKSIGNQTGDIKFELRGLTNDVFILYDNAFTNNTIDITFVNDNRVSEENSTKIAISQEVTLQEKGMYYFKISPSYNGENVDIMFDLPDSVTSSMFIQEQHPKGFSYAIEVFIGAVNGLISINLNLWKLLYYVLLIGISITGIVIVVGGMWAFIMWSEKFKKAKKRALRRGKED